MYICIHIYIYIYSFFTYIYICVHEYRNVHIYIPWLHRYSWSTLVNAVWALFLRLFVLCTFSCPFFMFSDPFSPAFLPSLSFTPPLSPSLSHLISHSIPPSRPGSLAPWISHIGLLLLVFLLLFLGEVSWGVTTICQWHTQTHKHEQTSTRTRVHTHTHTHTHSLTHAHTHTHTHTHKQTRTTPKNNKSWLSESKRTHNTHSLQCGKVTVIQNSAAKSCRIEHLAGLFLELCHML